MSSDPFSLTKSNSSATAIEKSILNPTLPTSATPSLKPHVSPRKATLTASLLPPLFLENLLLICGCQVVLLQCKLLNDTPEHHREYSWGCEIIVWGWKWELFPTLKESPEVWVKKTLTQFCSAWWSKYGRSPWFSCIHSWSCRPSTHTLTNYPSKQQSDLFKP